MVFELPFKICKILLAVGVQRAKLYVWQHCSGRKQTVVHSSVSIAAATALQHPAAHGRHYILGVTSYRHLH